MTRDDVADIIDTLTAKLNDVGAWNFLVARLREYLRRDYANRAEVVASARDGDFLAHTALMAEFDDLVDRGDNVPGILREYGLNRAAQWKPPRHRPKSWDATRREIGIVAAVYVVHWKSGLALTRSRSSTRPCAAEEVRAALGRRGIKLSEKTIANLIGRWKWVAMSFHAQTLLEPPPG